MESSVLTHKKEQQIKNEGEFKLTVDCLLCDPPWACLLFYQIKN